ncbi:expressed unknown protein [Seminavis robusta]|uniref:Uncharacterized protein n=1 Tax=Seminavis robusta TaxID=568900 RepID=A0A9N8HNH0_9STRA|nr:expressed unknown protein [Seminavis robusta]|eukprot:Sro986_g228110.1 n/a (509) ;mRNA; r:21597-23286
MMQRSGPWTRQEEEYAEAIVAAFHGGRLTEIEHGQRLRKYLAEMLMCSPKRISKKYEGTNYKGKQTYRSDPTVTSGQLLETRQLLSVLEQRFLHSIDSTPRRDRPAAGQLSAAAAAPRSETRPWSHDALLHQAAAAQDPSSSSNSALLGGRLPSSGAAAATRGNPAAAFGADPVPSLSSLNAELYRRIANQQLAAGASTAAGGGFASSLQFPTASLPSAASATVSRNLSDITAAASLWAGGDSTMAAAPTGGLTGRSTGSSSLATTGALSRASLTQGGWESYLLSSGNAQALSNRNHQGNTDAFQRGILNASDIDSILLAQQRGSLWPALSIRQAGMSSPRFPGAAARASNANERDAIASLSLPTSQARVPFASAQLGLSQMASLPEAPRPQGPLVAAADTSSSLAALGSSILGRDFQSLANLNSGRGFGANRLLGAPTATTAATLPNVSLVMQEAARRDERRLQAGGTMAAEACMLPGSAAEERKRPSEDDEVQHDASPSKRRKKGT